MSQGSHELKELDMEVDRYKKAVNRNLYEIAHALLEHKVLKKIDEFNKRKPIYVYGESFFGITYRALFNDMMAHTIKVLDQNSQSATFWYLLKEVDKVSKLQKYSAKQIESLEELSKRLKTVRDKTHFHIDKDGVLNPNAIWESVGIKGRELEDALIYVHSFLLELYQTEMNKSFLYCIEDYNGEDVTKLLDCAESENWFQGNL